MKKTPPLKTYHYTSKSGEGKLQLAHDFAFPVPLSPQRNSRASASPSMGRRFYRYE